MDGQVAKISVDEFMANYKAGTGVPPEKAPPVSGKMSVDEFMAGYKTGVPSIEKPAEKPAAVPGAPTMLERGKEAVADFFRPSFAPEPTVPAGMEGMPESAIPAGMSMDIPARRAEIDKRLGQISAGATTDNIDNLQAQIEGITSQAIDGALPPDLYEQYTALRPQYEQAIDAYNAQVTEAQELGGELQDLEQQEYGAEMMRPISTVTGEPVPTFEEEAAGGRAAMAIIPYGFASVVRGAIPGALERAVMDPITEAVVGKEYVSPIDEALKIGKYLPEAGQVAIGAPAHMAGAIVPLSMSFKTASAIMKAVGLPPDLVLRTGPVMDRITAHVARGGIAGAVYGGLEAGTPKGMAEDAAFFGALEGGLGAVGGIFRKIFSANWYRNLEVKERGLVVQSLDDMLDRGYSEGEILKQWNNPMWREEALARRAVREPPPEPAAPHLSETQRNLAKEVIQEELAKQPSLPPAIPERQVPLVPPGMPPPVGPPPTGLAPGVLPPGQGFELIEPTPEVRLRPGPRPRRGPEYPEGAEYVAGRPAPEELVVEHKPILGSHGLPWKEEENALKAFESKRLIEAGITEETHKVVPVKNGFVIERKAAAEKEIVEERKPHEMTLEEFEAAGHRPADITEDQWVDMMRRHRRALGQPEESGTPYNLFGDYIEFHAADVRALEAKEEVEKPKAEVPPVAEVVPKKPVVKELPAKPKEPEVVMSPELRELHDHKARILGFEKAGGSFVEGYLKKLAKVAEKTDMSAAMAAYNALSEYKKGNIGQASLEAEKILGKLHKAETEALISKPKVEPKIEPKVKIEKFEEITAETIRAKLPEAVRNLSIDRIAANNLKYVYKALDTDYATVYSILKAEEKPEEPKREDPRIAAIGTVTGSKVDMIEEREWEIGWADEIGELKKGSYRYDNLVGMLGGYKANRFIESGLSIRPKKREKVVPEVPEVAPVVKPKLKATPALGLARWVKYEFNQKHPITWRDLYKAADMFYGGTQAEGKYTSRQAFDAMELGMNLWIQEHIKKGMDPVEAIRLLDKQQGALATQTKRTKEQIVFQQFSTPPTHSYAMAWVANIGPYDVILEPSAGTGSLVIQALINKPAEVIANELNERRAKLLESLGIKVYKENAVHLNAVLPAEVKPTVILMNPPFSSDILLKGKKKKTGTGAEHIEQALMRLEEEGRLVALAGRGMALDRPAFREWWKGIRDKYTVKAVISISGKEYKKYGTDFDNVLIVIDKIGPNIAQDDPGITVGTVDKVEEVVPLLEGIHGERTAAGKRRVVEPVVEEGVERPEVEAEPGRPIPPAVDVMGIKGEERPVLPAKLPGPPGRGRVPGEARPEGGIAAPPGRLPSGREPVRGVKPEERKPTAGEPGVPPDTTAPPLVSERRPGIPDKDVTGRVSPDIEFVENKPTGKKKELTDSLYEPYVPSIKIKGAQKHTSPIAESAAMAAVEVPGISYKPKIPQDLIDSGKLSDIQLEFIASAGETHEQIMPDGQRAGIMCGDGTGVGKGAQQAGIILDNWNRGRKKAVWISENMRLVQDAKRDINWVGMDASSVVFIPKAGEKIKRSDGVLFTTYDTLGRISNPKYDTMGNEIAPAEARIDQLTAWLGRDFDGVICFDESHNMAKCIETRGVRGAKPPAKKALAGVDLQNALPNARIVYASATAATEVENLAYCERLGLWGEGTAFSSKTRFIQSIKAGGVAAMEVVASNLKSMGRMVSRTLAYSIPGRPDQTLTYRTLNHKISAGDKKVYNELAKAWQIVLENIDDALEITGGDQSSIAKRNALGQFWGAHQRFFNQILTSLPTPSLIKDMEKQLEAGNSCVLQLFNTNEALLERRRAQAEEAGLALEDIDLTPRDMLIQYLEKSFPVNRWEEYYDPDTDSTRTRVVRDSEGEIVKDPLAIAKREELIKSVAGLAVPETVIERVINHFGSSSVTEITGRKRRLVRKPDGTVVEEKMTPASRAKDVDAFMDGEKHILLFSNAGGTGRSYHADLDFKNQEKRIHYLVQPGWIASRALQGFGRTHRTNQRVAPEDVLVTTNIAAHKRFFSSIARRLDQVGALTKGERKTAGQGMFSADMNLENEYADMALATLFRDMQRDTADLGELTPTEVAKQMGFGEIDEIEGDIVRALNLDMTKFLNRLLSMEIDSQNKIFEAFIERLEAQIQYAIDQGTYETGIETLRADKIEKISEQDIDVPIGKAKYTELELTRPARIIKYEDLPISGTSRFLRNKRSGKFYFFKRGVDITDADGTIRARVVRVSPIATTHMNMSDVTEEKYEQITRNTKALWNATLKDLPKTQTTTEHVVSGTLLPIWDRLPKEAPKVVRVRTNDGEIILGRRIHREALSQTKRALGLGIERPVEVTREQALSALLENDATLVLANNWTIKTRTVSGEDRIEVAGPTGSDVDLLEGFGAFTEIISYKLRVFVPIDQAEQIIGRIIKNKPVVEIQGRRGEAVSIVDRLLDNEKGSSEFINDLSRLGADVMKRGYVKFKDFSAEMQKVAGSVWEKIKSLIRKAYFAAKKILKSEKGAVEIGKPKPKPKPEIGREVISKDGTTVDWDRSRVITKEKVTHKCYATYNKDGSFKKWRTREAINKIRALKKAEVRHRERLGKAKEKFDVQVEKIKTAKDIIKRRREKIRAVRDYFHLSDADLKKITRRDIRLMSNLEFKQFIDDIRVKAERFVERRQALNELELLRKEKAFIAEDNIRIFHKLPTIKKMTTEQLNTYAGILNKYERGDQFLTPKRVRGVENTLWSGSKTIREVLEKASKEFDVPLSELVGIRVSEIDRFRYDTSLARQNPFYNFMVDTINLASIKNQFKYFKEREKLYRLADLALKSRKRGFIGRLVPRQKELMMYMEAEGDAKLAASTELTTEEMALADAIEDFYRRAYNWLLVSQELKSSRFADSKYVFHSKRPLSELLVDLKDTGIKSAAKDLLNRWRLDEAQFKILDSKTGEILRMKKFFRQTLYRTGELTPTKNVIKATDMYMQQFFKKMALDESVPAIETLAMALRPKERTKTGIFLNDSLMTFVKEYLNGKKGRALSIGIQQGGKIDTVIRFVNQIISLRYIALNIPLEVAAIVGETTAKLPALGNRKLILANMRRHTPRGKRILKKYKAFTGEGVFEEVLQPARNIGENINMLLYGLFKWSRKVTKQDILLGNMTRAEFEAETIDPKKLAEITKLAGRWLDIEGSKSVMGTTSTGAAITKFKGWAIPIATSAAQNATSLARTLTRLGDPKKRLTVQQSRELYRIAEMGAILCAVLSLDIDDDDKDTFAGRLKYYAIRELGTLYNALSLRTMLTFGVTIAFLEKLSQNLYLLMSLEKYKTRDELKGVAALKKQLTPAAISQFKGKKKPEPKKKKGLSARGLSGGRIKSRLE